jgi:putative membrane protein
MHYMSKIFRLTASLTAWYLICTLANAGQLSPLSLAPKNTTQTAQTNLSTIDRKFINLGNVSSATEIAASRLALAQSSSMKVQYFARLLISDHQKMAHEFSEIAHRIGWNASAYGPDPEIVDKLKKLKQADFDQAYLGKVAVAGQHQEIELFALEANQGRNDTLRALAVRMLPLIQHHFKMGEQLIQEIHDDSEKPFEHEEIPITLVFWGSGITQ